MTSTVSLRAAIYTRFSHADGDSDSCAVQEQMARQAIEAQGWTLTEAREDDGISGREMIRRPGLNDLLERAKAGAFDVLVCRDMDRLFRGETGRVLGILQLLHDQGTRVWEYTRKDFVRLDGEHVLMTSFRAYGNRAEALKASSRIKEKLLVRDEAGSMTSRAPFGFRNLRSKDGRVGVFLDRKGTVGAVVRDENEYPTLLLIGDLFLEIGSFNGVAMELNRRLIPDPSGNQNWQAQTVRNILRSPAYRGQILRGRETTAEKAGSIVRLRAPAESVRTYDRPEMRVWSPETITKIDALMAARARTTTWSVTTRKHLSSSFIRCPCGGSISISSSARSKHKTYACTRHRSKGCSAGLGYRDEKKVDEAVITACMAILSDEILTRVREIITMALDVREQHDTRLVEHDRLTRDIATTEKRIRSAEELVLDSEGAERARHRTTLRELLDRLAALQGQLQQVEAQEAPPDPRAVLAELDARVAELRAGLAKGGVEALPTVAAILQGQRLTATRTPEGRWDLRGEGSLSVFYKADGKQKVPTGFVEQLPAVELRAVA